MKVILSRFIALMLMVGVSWLSGCGRSDSQLTANDEQAEQPFWPVNKAGDPQLSTSHSLSIYFQAAQAKALPGNYFRDLISANASISVKYAEWPRYQPGRFSGGTLYHPGIGKAPSTWTTNDWSGFYNELFHAWWGNVFTKAAKYQGQRAQLLTSERKAHYRQANPGDPLLAQEEAYSETIGTLMIYMHPKYNPNMPQQRGYMTLADYKYNIGRTVSPVSHSEQPGYTPAAESTYPNPAEYAVMFSILTDTQPPTDN